MNIELRWLERSVPIGHGLAQWERVLQYRQYLPVNGINGVHEWSDWRDVPVVKEAE